MAKAPHLFLQQAKAPGSHVDCATAYAVEQFLYAEAELLDSWQYKEWLGLMAPDLHYWAPVRENRDPRDQAKEVYSEGSAAHFDETFDLLAERVRRLNTNRAWGETPPSRARHLVTNVRVFASKTHEGEFDVESSFHVYRTNGERYEDSVVGKRYDTLRPADNPYGFVIAKRIIVFDMAMLLVKNLSLFY